MHITSNKIDNEKFIHMKKNCHWECTLSYMRINVWMRLSTYPCTWTAQIGPIRAAWVHKPRLKHDYTVCFSHKLMLPCIFTSCTYVDVLK
jgi:hypothetical protein